MDRVKRPRTTDLDGALGRACRHPYTAITLCFFVLALEGIDVTIVGYLAPRMREALELPTAALAPLFSAALIGLFFGALVSGPLADRIGRKPVILFSILDFGLATIATALAPGLKTMILSRLVAGAGLGGAMPNAVTLAAERSPDRQRGFLVSLAYGGFTVGAAITGIAVAKTIGAHDWRTIMAAAGAVPLATFPVLLLWLPESLSRRNVAAPASPPHGKHNTAPTRSGPISFIFERNVARLTLTLWLVFFMSLFLIQLFVNWLPVFLRTAGDPLTDAAHTTALFQIGGAIGALVIGTAVTRHSSGRLLALGYACAAACIYALGHCVATARFPAGVAFMTGFFLIGSFIGSNIFATWRYPMHCRSTGLSWANGIGRGGAIIGATAGAQLLAIQHSWTVIFLVLALPAIASTIALSRISPPPI